MAEEQLLSKDELVKLIAELSDRAEEAGQEEVAGILAAVASCILSGSEAMLLEAALAVSQLGIDILRDTEEGVN